MTIKLTDAAKEEWVPFACTINKSKFRHRVLLEVSNKGRRRTSSIESGKPYLTGGGSNSSGYRLFGRFGLAHRIVAQVFIVGDLSMSVDHINGIKHDNRVENLQWLSISEHIRLEFARGKMDGFKPNFSKEYLAYLSEKQTGKPPTNRDETIYHYYHEVSGRSIFCRRSYLEKNNHLMGVGKGQVRNLSNGTRQITNNGWIKI